MRLFKHVATLAYTAALSFTGCTSFDARTTEPPHFNQMLPPAYSLQQRERTVIEEQHQEYVDKMKGTYVPKTYRPDAPLPKDGYSFATTTFLYQWEKNSNQRAREMMFDDLTFNTLQQFPYITNTRDWNLFVRQGMHDFAGDQLEENFLQEAQNDTKSAFTRGFTDALREFSWYRTTTQELSDLTFGVVEARYTGRSKLIPQIPVIDEFQDKVQNPQKYEPEHPTDQNWWIEKMKDVKLGVDFTTDVANLSSNNISKVFPHISLRWASLLRLRLDVATNQLESSVSLNKGDFAFAVSSVTDYHVFEPQNVSAGFAYLVTKHAIVRVAARYDLEQDPEGQHLSFEDRFGGTIEMFIRF